MTAAVTPVTPSRARSYSPAWWGMAMLITTESMIFVSLLGAYFFLRASADTWPLGGIELPPLPAAWIFSAVLWGSSLPLFWAEAGIRRGSVRRLRIGLLVSWLMGAAFLLHTAKDFRDLHFGWRDNAYGSIFYTIVGLHAFHVVVGLAISLVVQLKAGMGKLDASRHESAAIFFLYWHFVDLVWVAVFGSLFVGAHVR